MAVYQPASLHALARDLLDEAPGLPTSTFSPFQSSQSSHRPKLYLSSNIKQLPWNDATPIRPHPTQQTIVYADVYPVYSYNQSTTSSSLSSSSSRPSPTFSTRSWGSSESRSPTQTPLWPINPPLHHHPILRSKPNLRRKESPRVETLRQLRAKDSESELRKVYEKQTLSYLEDSAFITPESASMPAFRLLLTVPETSGR